MRETRYMISDASKKVEVEAHVLRYWEEELGLTIPRNELGHRYYREEDIALLTSIRKLKEKGFQLKAIRLLLPDINKVEALEPEQLYNLRDKLDVVLGIEREAEEEKGEEGEFKEKENRKVVDVTGRISVERPIKEETEEMIASVETEKSLEEVTTLEPEQGNVYVAGELNKGKLLEFRSIMGSIMSEAMGKNNETLVQELNQTVSDSVRREMEYFMRLKEEREEERFKQLDRTIREYQQLRQQTAAAKEIEEKKPRKKSKFFQKNNVRI